MMDTLGIFGLGYVGKEVCGLALEHGIDVYGVDIDDDVVRDVSVELDAVETDGTFRASTDSEAAVRHAQGYVVAVPTPLSSVYSVDLDPLTAVCEEAAEGIEPGDTPVPVVVESTIPPGTVSDLVAPIFERSGLAVGDDVYLAHAPERIDPGNQEWPIESLPRVVGAMTEDGTRAVIELYELLIDADIHPVPSPKVAAAAKIIENSYRDINIAFVNEIARTLDQFDIDAKTALDAAATKPFGFTRFSPGTGVGGHCIPIDPYFLIEKADENGYNSRFLKTAREINNSMPEYVVRKTIRAIVQDGTLPQESTALLLGKTFKPGTADTRNSPYFAIREGFAEYEIDIDTYDPLLPEDSSVDSVATGADVVVLVTDHLEFRDIDFAALAEAGTKLFVDGRNVFSPDAVERHGIQYVGVGR